MTFPASFLLIGATLALIGVLLHGGVARWIAGRIFGGNKHLARVAAFSVAIGYFFGAFSFGTRNMARAVMGFTQVFGGLIGLVIVWYLLIRRHRRTHDEANGFED